MDKSAWRFQKNNNRADISVIRWGRVKYSIVLISGFEHYLPLYFQSIQHTFHSKTYSILKGPIEYILEWGPLIEGPVGYERKIVA